MLGGDLLLGGLKVFRVVSPVARVIPGLFKFGQLGLDLSARDWCIGLLSRKRCDLSVYTIEALAPEKNTDNVNTLVQKDH